MFDSELETKDFTVNQKGGKSVKPKLVDKSSRATTENVLDPRTRMILFKILNRGIIDELNGCVSTGKEVYFKFDIL